MRLGANTPRLAVGLIRVSTAEQGNSGLGLEAQQASIRSFVAAQGWTMVAEYSDIASGKDDRRPGFQAALARCRQLGAVLVAARLDRITPRARTRCRSCWRTGSRSGPPTCPAPTTSCFGSMPPWRRGARADQRADACGAGGGQGAREGPGRGPRLPTSRRPRRHGSGPGAVRGGGTHRASARAGTGTPARRGDRRIRSTGPRAEQPWGSDAPRLDRLGHIRRSAARCSGHGLERAQPRPSVSVTSRMLKEKPQQSLAMRRGLSDPYRTRGCCRPTTRAPRRERATVQAPSCRRRHVAGPTVGVSTWHPTSDGLHPHCAHRPDLCDHQVSIARVHGAVLIGVKDDGRDATENGARLVGAAGGRTMAHALAHCRKCGRDVARRTAGKPGMNANCGINIGIGLRHDRRGCAAR